MRYTKREKLSIINLKELRATVTYDEVIEVLYERPANIIYIMHEDRLYGIVTDADIRRARKNGDKEITINTKFNQIAPGGVLEARQIFKTRPRIKGLPVIAEDGTFLGEYACWGEYLNERDIKLFETDAYVTYIIAQYYKQIVLVKPALVYEKKNQLIKKTCNVLKRKGIPVKVIDRRELTDCFEKADGIFFADEDELMGTKTLYNILLDKKLDEKKMQTLENRRFFALRTNINSGVFSHFLNKIKEQGVQIYTFEYEENDDLLCFFRKIKGKKDISGVDEDWYFKTSEQKREFYDEIYERYKNYEVPHFFTRIIEDNKLKLKDEDLSLMTIKNGTRCTVDQPEKYERTIYMYGDCMVLGMYVEDQLTIESLLQKKINEKGMRWRVENRGGQSVPLEITEAIESTPLKTGDIIFIHPRQVFFDGISNINLTPLLNSTPVEWYVDTHMHCNHKVNELIADELYKRIEPLNKENSHERNEVHIEQNIGIQYYADFYAKEIGDTTQGVIGSIVMNCNPFTYGHRYLIEEASKRVDKLIIFVVEEDESFFSFEERLAMVRAGVADLNNVVVIPSGTYILSNVTFPQYFAKVLDTELVQNVERDITIFAKQVAPAFHITYRFVGEEPIDMVTREYNLAMHRILPVHGIEVVEIPRKQKGGAVISASLVRKLIEAGEYEKIDELIPESTKYAILCENS